MLVVAVQGSQSALEVINTRDIYDVMGDTKTCYHLFDLQRYSASQRMQRIGSAWADACRSG
jgi:hypothetical protein